MHNRKGSAKIVNCKQKMLSVNTKYYIIKVQQILALRSFSYSGKRYLKNDSALYTK